MQLRQLDTAWALACAVALVLVSATTLPGANTHELGPSPDRVSGLAHGRLSSVQWPDRAEISLTARARIPAESLAGLDAIKVPVLVPNVAELRGASFSGDELGYSVSLSRPNTFGLVLYAYDIGLTGEGSIFDIERGGAVRRGDGQVRGHEAVVEESEAIWRVTWEENGVRYRLMLGCGVAVESETECEGVRDALVSNLVVVGGAFDGD